MPEFQLDIERSGSDGNEARPEEARAEREEEGKRIRRRDILNLINFINFQEGTIFAQFRHLKYDESVSIRALPRPCVDETLECVWTPRALSMDRLRSYAFDGLLMSDGQDVFRVKAEATRLDERGGLFKLPDFGHEKSGRQVRRHDCAGIAVGLMQNGIALEGRLVDFSAVSCRAELAGTDYRTARWINPDVPVVMTMEKSGTLLFSGECSITRFEGPAVAGQLVLTPSFNNLRRYRAREYRSARHKLVPAPNVHFEHPLTGKRVYLQATDLSSSGFATEEFFHSSTLLPGLMIPEITVELGNGFLLRCRGQVLYRNVYAPDQSAPLAKCGIAFLDMSLSDQAELSALLHQTANNRLRVCNRVDMDELWRFFFDSGFIYPSKYVAIENDKEEFKRTYEKLYMDSPDIARHFVFQDRGAIFGHMSMIRNHARTWLIHHHAADRSGYGMAGIAVLDQVGQYINEFHLHHATHMDYVMCYYRKENRFPSRVFGGVAKDIANPKASSIDEFAYYRLERKTNACVQPYQIMPANKEDIKEVVRSYEASSGGLALEALNIGMFDASEGELDRAYEANGFARNRSVFSLKRDGLLVAAVSVTVTETGLNMSSLTNCAHAFVIDEDRLPIDVFESALADILNHFETPDIPILVFPAKYAESIQIPFEKKYILWTFKMDFLDSYFKSLKQTFKRDVHGKPS